MLLLMLPTSNFSPLYFSCFLFFMFPPPFLGLIKRQKGNKRAGIPGMCSSLLDSLSSSTESPSASALQEECFSESSAQCFPNTRVTVLAANFSFYPLQPLVIWNLGWSSSLSVFLHQTGHLSCSPHSILHLFSSISFHSSNKLWLFIPLLLSPVLGYSGTHSQQLRR